MSCVSVHAALCTPQQGSDLRMGPRVEKRAHLHIARPCAAGEVALRLELRKLRRIIGICARTHPAVTTPVDSRPLTAAMQGRRLPCQHNEPIC